MAVFSKRTLQNIIDQNATFLSVEKLEALINRLNNGFLDAEWEAVILNALHKMGVVKYEESLGGETYPDIYFAAKDGKLVFVADITTVSDRNYNECNPIEEFINETIRIFKKRGIRPSGLHYEIGSTELKKGMKLKLPRRGQFHIFFKSDDFNSFIARIKESPHASHNLSVESDETSIKFIYKPDGEYITGHHAAYKISHSLTQNPIYNALKQKKDQLKRSGYTGPLGIFLCDGGCDLLTRTIRDWRSYNCNQVISEFLRQNSSISFILTLSVIARRRPIDAKMYINSDALPMAQDLSLFRGQLLSNLPSPVNTLINATRRVADGFEKKGESFYGGLMYKNNTIKISSRGLLELLAGIIEKDDFMKSHQFVPTDDHPHNVNLFERKLREGRLINNIHVEKSEDQDDDWLVFEFGPPDPAISKYIFKDPVRGT